MKKIIFFMIVTLVSSSLYAMPDIDYNPTTNEYFYPTDSINIQLSDATRAYKLLLKLNQLNPKGIKP